MLAPFASYATVCCTGIAVLAIELLHLTRFVHAGGKRARIGICALGIVVAATRDGREDAADIGVT